MTDIRLLRIGASPRHVAAVASAAINHIATRSEAQRIVCGLL